MLKLQCIAEFRVCSKDVRSKIGCSFRRRPIPFMVFLFIRLHGIERLVSTALEQGFFFFFEKTTSFPCLVGSELNYIFQLKAQSRIFTRSLLRLDTDIFFLIRKK